MDAVAGPGEEVLVVVVWCRKVALSGVFWRGGVGCGNHCRRREVGRPVAGLTTNIDGSAGRWRAGVGHPGC